MKKVAIYYFSGTGNTEIVVNMLKEEFSKYEYNVDVIKIEDVLRQDLKIETSKYDLVGIGCQVIGFGTPRIVKNFVKKLPKESGKKVFILRTAGGVAPQNYNASKPMIRKLKAKGYQVFHERLFSIGSNWCVRFDDEVVRKLYDATRKKVSIMCTELINGKTRTLKTGIGLKILMEVGAPVCSSILRFMGKDLIINKSCVHCGLCIKNCPAGNIYEKNGKIRFKSSCSSCMRCVYSCLKSAIGFRILTFFPVKGGYNVKKVLKEPCSDSEIVNESAPPFFNDYINNDSL